MLFLRGAYIFVLLWVCVVAVCTYVVSSFSCCLVLDVCFTCASLRVCAALLRQRSFAHLAHLKQLFPRWSTERVACFDAVAAEQLTAVPAAGPPPVQVERMTAVAAHCCVLITLPLVAG